MYMIVFTDISSALYCIVLDRDDRWDGEILDYYKGGGQGTASCRSSTDLLQSHQLLCCYVLMHYVSTSVDVYCIMSKHRKKKIQWVIFTKRNKNIFKNTRGM